MGNKISIGLSNVLGFIKIGIRNGRIGAAIDLIDDMLEQLPEIEEEFKKNKKDSQTMNIYKKYCIYCQSVEECNLGVPIPFSEWRRMLIRDNSELEN